MREATLGFTLASVEKCKEVHVYNGTCIYNIHVYIYKCVSLVIDCLD